MPETDNNTAYGAVGGDDAVRTLVDRFYDLMDLEPAYAGIRALHPNKLDGSRAKLFMFLSGSAGLTCTSSALATRGCARGICRMRSASRSAISGWLAWGRRCRSAGSKQHCASA